MDNIAMTGESEMVERVARAICAEDGFVFDEGYHHRLARAAIEAMRELTNAMCAAGSWGPMTAPDRVWQRMIDAALGKKTGGGT